METVYHPEDPRFYIKTELEARMKRRPHYSLRAFARDLELSPSTVSDFLNGKLGFSKERVYQLSKKLSLTEEQRDHWWDLLEAQFSRDSNGRKLAKVRATARTLESKSRLALEKFQVISEWQHFAIIELIDISSQYHSFEALGKSLGIGTKKARESIQRLEKLNLVDCHELPWKVNVGVTLSGGGVTVDKALREAHAQILQKAIQALETQPVTERESQSIIFAIDDRKIPEMKEEFHKILARFAMKHSEVSNKNSVYCMSSHLFSLMEKNSK